MEEMLISPEMQSMDRNCEKSFCVEIIDNCSVRDTNGKEVFFKSIRQGMTTVVIFLRHLLDYVTKEYVEDFSKVNLDTLKAANVQIIFVSCAPSKYSNCFKFQTSCLFEVYADSKRNIYKKLDLHENSVESTNSKQRSVHVKTNKFMGNVKTFLDSLKSQEFQGDMLQQGGEAIIDAHGRVIFFHRGKHRFDHTPLNDLLNILHLPLIDFSDRYRIKNL